LEKKVVQEAKGRKGERKLENCCKVFFGIGDRDIVAHSCGKCRN
jgi:hypothetical protein